MTLSERIRLTEGTQLIISVIKKYRVLAIIYAAISTAEFIFDFFPFPEPLRMLMLIFGFMLPTGIIVAIFMDGVRHLKIIKIFLIVGFVSTIFGSVYTFITQVSVYMADSFLTMSSGFRLLTTIGQLMRVINMIISVGFLLIIISNVTSKKLGLVLFVMLITNVVLYIATFSYFFPNMGENFEFIFSNNLYSFYGAYSIKIVISWFFSLLGIVTTALVYMFEICIASRLL